MVFFLAVVRCSSRRLQNFAVCHEFCTDCRFLCILHAEICVNSIAVNTLFCFILVQLSEVYIDPN